MKWIKANFRPGSLQAHMERAILGWTFIGRVFDGHIFKDVRQAERAEQEVKQRDVIDCGMVSEAQMTTSELSHVEDREQALCSLVSARRLSKPL